MKWNLLSFEELEEEIQAQLDNQREDSKKIIQFCINRIGSLHSIKKAEETVAKYGLSAVGIKYQLLTKTAKLKTKNKEVIIKVRSYRNA